MNIYCVYAENTGKVHTQVALVIFAHREDAEAFQRAVSFKTHIEVRHLWYGQPPIQGYNR